MSKTNWELFTREEKDNIKKLQKQGKWQNIPTIIENITPAKEIELQKIVNSLKPLADGFKSEVRREYEKKYPEGPKTPEEEKEMQEALDREWAEYAEKKKKQETERLAAMGDEEAKDKVVEGKLEDKKRDELEEIATELGIKEPEKYANKKDLIKDIKKIIKQAK
jgi:hypothetical protein